MFPIMWMKIKALLALNMFKLNFYYFRSVAIYLIQNNKAKYTVIYCNIRENKKEEGRKIT